MPGYARHVGACYVLVFRVEAKCKLKVGKCAKENSFPFPCSPSTTQRIDGENIRSVHGVHIFVSVSVCKLYDGQNIFFVFPCKVFPSHLQAQVKLSSS